MTTPDLPGIQSIGSSQALLGEGAYWSRRDDCLYWVDIRGKRIFRAQSDGSGERSWETPAEIGFIVEDPFSEHFLGALRKGIARIALPADHGTARVQYFAMPEDDLQQNRFNDGAIDPFGNIWVGSMDDGERQASGNWWHIDQRGTAKRLLSGFRVANGPAFSPDGRHVYLNDSALQRTFRAEFDAFGLTSEPRLWKQYSEGDGYPDGMSFCPNGLLWIAFWDAQCLCAFDEHGQARRKLSLPVKRPTKPTFDPAGRGYVTSAKIGLDDDGIQGRVFAFEIGAEG